MKRAIVIVTLFFTLLFVSAGPSFADTINGCIGRFGGFLRIVNAPSQCGNFETPISWNNVKGIQAAAYGTVALIGGNTTTPPSITVTHTPGSGIYDITFNPNPFTPSPGGAQAFENMPTCLASTDRNNPVAHRASCSVGMGYNTTTGAWSATGFCKLDETGALQDADFDFICVQE